ncbi:hypothetical protein [Methylobacterium nodulans]|uniref:Uncharacterized protein n=1 Tax=Methylobacterium nodulans (strain LMG 21967 / CNCM I-2342 / ORS 2060) TaxID=460265 RepID=B8IY24_METNO|nr:hypothetical protein [Methylobacterium nodulans]ACL63314.1 hypothetical protein Mnod_7721 [Methylobacterium nodulans ORS 2060]
MACQYNRRRRIYDALEIQPFCLPRPQHIQSFDLLGLLSAPIIFQGRSAELRYSNVREEGWKNNFASQLLKETGKTAYGEAYIVFGHNLMYRHAAKDEPDEIYPLLADMPLKHQVLVLEGDLQATHWAVYTSDQNDAFLVKMYIP